MTTSRREILAGLAALAAAGPRRGWASSAAPAYVTGKLGLAL